MFLILKFRLPVLLACMAIVVQGCGGGGGAAPATGAVTGSLSGTVAVGSAIAGATVEAKCVKGSGTVATNAAGQYALTVTGIEYPCMLKASGGTLPGGQSNAETFYSVATGSGRFNITPLTHMMVAKAMGKQPADAFAVFGGSATDIAAVNASNLGAAQTAIVTEAAKLGVTANLGSTNLLTVAFSAVTGDFVDLYTSLVYQGLSQNAKTLTTATQELLASSAGLQITGSPKTVCRPGVIAGFKGQLGTDTKLAFVPISVDLSTVADGGGGGDAGAGGGDGSAGDGSLGQFFSTTIKVEKSDGSVLGEVKTSDSSGAFTMVTCGYTGPLKITASGTAGSKYFDEGLGTTVSFEGEQMRVVVDSVTKNIGITPFTEAAYQYLTTKLNPSNLTGTAAWADAARINQANQKILSVVNRLLPKEMFLTDITRMPAVVGPTTTAGSIPDTANGIYGLAIAALAVQTKNFNASLTRPGLDGLKQLANDLADGVLDRSVAQTGLGVTSLASQAAYTADTLADSISAAAGLLAKQTGVASLANRKYTVTRIVWNASSASYVNSLPSLPGLGKYSYADLMSDGSVRIVHPTTGQVMADSLDVTKSPFLVPATGAQVKIVKLIGGIPVLLALDSNGNLFAAGNAGPRQGNGVVSGDQPLFHPVPSTWGGAGVSMLSHTGGDTAYARTSDGRIWGWGFNYAGQMGTVNADSYVPASLFPSVTDVVSISMSGESMFAVKADGTAWSWGQNTIDSGLGRYGRLGRGTGVLPFTNQLGQIAGLTNVVSIVPSAKAVFALNGSGEVFAWGNHFCNVLGDSVANTVPYTGTPAKLGLTDVVAITTSGATGYALKGDGTLVYWGSLPANVLDPGETWTDRSPAVCKRLPAVVPFIAGDSRNPGLDSNSKFVKLEKAGYGAVATTADGKIAVIYGSNAFGANTNN